MPDLIDIDANDGGSAPVRAIFFLQLYFFYYNLCRSYLFEIAFDLYYLGKLAKIFFYKTAFRFACSVLALIFIFTCVLWALFEC